MHATVAICTRNRADSLRRTLQSLAEMRKPPQSRNWELLVVDNGSTDNTHEVIAEFKEKLPIVLATEERMGLSHARNTVLRHARGDHIIWTDDDVLVGSDWLAVYFNAFDVFPDGGIFGGRVTPVLEEPIEPWFRNNPKMIRDLFCARDIRGAVSPVTGKGRLPVGANFSVRRSLLVGKCFDTRLGRSGTGLRGGEEVELVAELLTAGAKGYWLPSAEVTHCIPQSRQLLSYLRRYAQDAGETSVIRDVLSGKTSPLLATLNHLLKATIYGALYLVSLPTHPARLWLRSFLGVRAHLHAILFLGSGIFRKETIA